MHRRIVAFCFIILENFLKISPYSGKLSKLFAHFTFMLENIPNCFIVENIQNYLAYSGKFP